MPVAFFGELDGFLAMAGAAGAAVHLPAFRPAAAEAAAAAAEGAVLALGDEEVAAEVGELQAMAAAAEAPARAAFARRSDELMAHCRSARTCKARGRRHDAEVARRERAELQLQVVVAAEPSMRSIVGASLPSTKLPSSVVAALTLRLAALPRIRSAALRSQRHQQSRALALVADILSERRQKCWDSMRASQHESASLDPTSVLMFACQWDETSQRFRSLQQKSASGATLSSSPLAAQCMVFNGSMVEIGIQACVQIEPFFSRTMVVEEMSANYLLEGVLRSLPFAFEDKEHMVALLARTDLFVFSVTVDRASANLSAAAWLAHHSSQLPRTILPWAEYCAAHGVALVKGKAPLLKCLATALNSFTLWMRFSRNVQALSAELTFEIGRTLVVRREACPAEFMQQGRLLVKTIYGGDSSGALWQWDARKGHLVETCFFKDLLAVCKVTNFGCGGPAWVHHCFVEPGSPAALAGQPVGSACCRSRRESVAKVAAAVDAVWQGRAWKVACII
jgi:hypothetical protein